MKRIKLTKGKYALVDDEDFDYLNQWKWHLSSKGYAMRGTHIGSVKNGTRKAVRFRMHRILDKTPDGFQTDHINRDKLDNRKSNLRTVTNRQNHFNMPLQKNNTSGHKGVYWNKANRKWQAYIKSTEKILYLGCFSDIKDAIRARRKAEKIHHAI